MFTCIYCLKDEPEVTPSKAHIFPDVVGGVTSTRRTVCVGCNGIINREVETPTLSTFALFQSIWGIKGRRKRIKGVPATLRVAGKEMDALLDQKGEPKPAIIFIGIDETGKRTYSIIGPANKVEDKRQEITRKYPNIQWQEMNLKQMSPPEAVIEFNGDLSRLPLRRLAAKVAFERWAQLPNSLLLSDHQYDVIRDFITTGKEHELRCGLLADSTLLNRFLNFPLPNHGVAIIAHPDSRVLGGFVTFYSLFYFWVMLSTQYRSLGPFDDLLLENPQTAETQNPKFRRHTGGLLISWNVLVDAYRNKPKDIIHNAMGQAIKKFNDAAKDFYGC